MPAIRLLILLICYATLSAGGLGLIKKAFIKKSPIVSDSWWTCLYDPSLVLGIVCYGSGFLVWLWLLKMHELSFIFPVAAATMMIVTSLVGCIFYNEALTSGKIIGMGLICCGMVALFRK